MEKNEELKHLRYIIGLELIDVYKIGLERNYPAYDYHIDQILIACKEAGLKFTRTGVRGDDIEGSCLCQVEEIDID